MWMDPDLLPSNALKVAQLRIELQKSDLTNLDFTQLPDPFWEDPGARYDLANYLQRKKDLMSL